MLNAYCLQGPAEVGGCWVRQLLKFTRGVIVNNLSKSLF